MFNSKVLFKPGEAEITIHPFGYQSRYVQPSIDQGLKAASKIDDVVTSEGAVMFDLPPTAMAQDKTYYRFHRDMALGYQLPEESNGNRYM